MTDTQTPPETPQEPQWATIPTVPDRVRESGIGTIVAALVERLEQLTAAVEALGGTAPQEGGTGGTTTPTA